MVRDDMSPLEAVGKHQRVSNWRLAKVEAAAFGDSRQAREQWPLMRHGSLRVATWVVLVLCECRVNDRGTALCILTPHSRGAWLRAAGRAVAFVLLGIAVAVALGAVWWPLPWCLAVLVLLAIGPCARSGWRNRRAQNQLSALGPYSPHVYVHGVARLPEPECKGDAAIVMARLAEEADKRGWILTLDAGAPPLVPYYQQFGFEPLGPPVEMTWGSTVRMARRPLVGYA